MIATLFLLALMQIKVPDAAQFVGAPQGTPLTGPQLERRTMEISSELRCPVCQGLAIGDSPSEMAISMKKQVRELLARGFTLLRRRLAAADQELQLVHALLNRSGRGPLRGVRRRRRGRDDREAERGASDRHFSRASAADTSRRPRSSP